MKIFVFCNKRDSSERYFVIRERRGDAWKELGRLAGLSSGLIGIYSVVLEVEIPEKLVEVYSPLSHVV